MATSLNNPLVTRKIIVALISPNDVDREIISGKIKDFGVTQPYNFEVLTFRGVPIGENSQRAIDNFIMGANITIATFRNKVGTKFENESSATVHEINNVLLRRMRKKNEKNAPQIKVYFLMPDILKNSDESKTLNTEMLNGLLEIQNLKMAVGKAEKLYGEHKDDAEMHTKIIADLDSYVKSLTGDTSHLEADFFTENMIAEKVFAYLEMDNGYSEKIFRLFDVFRFSDGKDDKYYTNFIFDYATLDNERLGLLQQRFKSLFANFICESIQEFRVNEAKKVVEDFPEIIKFNNFKDFAHILFDDTNKNNTHTFESILDVSSINLVVDIAETLRSVVYWKIRNVDEKFPKEDKRLEYIKEKNADIKQRCSDEERCTHLLATNSHGKKKALVFLFPMVTQTLLSNMNRALTYLLVNDAVTYKDGNATYKEGAVSYTKDDYPDVFLFSVVESPRNEELTYHIKHSDSDDINILKFLEGIEKFHYYSYMDRTKLESNEIIEKVYYNM